MSTDDKKDEKKVGKVMKHSPEPWKPYRCDFWSERIAVEECCGFEYGDGSMAHYCDCEGCAHDVSLADTERACACVNAMTGIEDLEEFVKRAKKALSVAKTDVIRLMPPGFREHANKGYGQYYLVYTPHDGLASTMTTSDYDIALDHCSRYADRYANVDIYGEEGDKLVLVAEYSSA